MHNPPLTLKDAAAYRYGCWAGVPKGRAYDPARCAMEVSPAHSGGYTYSQCSRPNGHGHANLYCKQHAKKVTP